MATPEKIEDNPVNGRCPVTGNSWRQRESADDIPCPALLSFYNNGLLTPDANGIVTTADLDEVLTSVGVNATVRNVLVKGADESDAVKGEPTRDGKFNLFTLRNSPLDHTGSTGIRDPQVNPDKLKSNLLNFGENGRMYAEHFAAAANHNQKEDPGIKGTITQTIEFTALLEVFGRLDESKKRYLTDEDVKGLWIDGKFPADWKPRNENEPGVAGLSLGIADMVLKRVLKATGF